MENTFLEYLKQVNYNLFEKIKTETIYDLFRKNNIPETLFSDLRETTEDHRVLLEYFTEKYQKKQILTISEFNNKLCAEYENCSEICCRKTLDVLVVCSLITKIPFSLFANIISHYQLSTYKTNKLVKEKFIFFEKKGYYYFSPFFKEFLARAKTKYYTTEKIEESRKILLHYIQKEKHFDLEYLNLCMDQAEQEVLENKIVTCILLYGSEYFIEGYHKLSSKNLFRKDLKLFLLLKNNKFLNSATINYLITDFKHEKLYLHIQAEYYYYMGRNLKVAEIDNQPGNELEKSYYNIIDSWVNGEKANIELSAEFYRKYSFYNVPEFIIYKIDVYPLLKANKVRAYEFNSRITALYYFYLKGENDKSKHLFYYILRNYRDILLDNSRKLYYFMLACHFYSDKKYAKAKSYLNNLLIAFNEDGDKIFILKVFNLYMRILVEEKNIAGLTDLLKLSGNLLLNEKPFNHFRDLLRSTLTIVKGGKLDHKIDQLIEYSLRIGDQVSALQYCSYGVNTGRSEFKDILKVKESQLDENQIAIYHNTSMVENYRKVEIVVNFFSDYRLKLNSVDFTQEISMRNKLRRIFNYLIYAYPNSVSREELKREFWNQDEHFDVDANLRVSISHLRRMFKEIGFGDIIKGESGRLYIDDKYVVNCDYNSFVTAYKKGKALYNNKEYEIAEKILLKIIKVDHEIVFKDIKKEYFEEKIINKVKLMVVASLEMLLKLVKSRKDFITAKNYCLQLSKLDSKYSYEYENILNILGERNEHTDKNIEKKDDSLTKLFFPD